MSPRHGGCPGATPGSRTNFHYVSRAPACAAESPKLSMPGAAPGRLANYHFWGSWQTSNALALQASSYGGGTHRLHHFTPLQSIRFLLVDSRSLATIRRFLRPGKLTNRR